jgi:2-methylcitrate dehydratase
MLDKANEKSPRPVAMVRRLADWVGLFAASPIPATTLERTRAILLDSLACALYAATDEKAQPSLRTVEELGGNGACSVIGTPLKTSLPLAGFASGVLIRTLDLNDTYAGPRQIGHPSDNLGAALAAAEMAERSGEDLVRAIRMGYEVYGRILDIGDPESPWDHVTVSGLVTAAITGWLLRLPPDRLAHALALAAMHCATLGEVRVGHVSAAKSIANSVVVQTACLHTLLAAHGTTGPLEAIEGARGYAKLILDGADFSSFFEEGKPDRLMSVGLKQYPCFALGQGPISAAVELRARLRQPIAVEHLKVSLADTGPARLRLRDSLGRVPSSREAADHSVYFLVAVALLDGRFGLDQLSGGRWQDADVHALIERMEAVIDKGLQPATSLPCRLEATLANGERVTIERPVTPGNPKLPLSWDEVVQKFRRCAAGVLDADAQAAVIDAVARVETLPSVRRLLTQLVPAEVKSGN